MGGGGDWCALHVMEKKKQQRHKRQTCVNTVESLERRIRQTGRTNVPNLKGEPDVRTIIYEKSLLDWPVTSGG
jgi:hypothetical protein